MEQHYHRPFQGRIFDETLPLLAAASIVPVEVGDVAQADHRHQPRDVRVVIVRATDVPTYVRYGAADLGVAGKDVLIGTAARGLYQPLDLNIAKCRMMVAVPGLRLRRRAVRQGNRLKVASKVHQDGARALCRQGRACRPDQALRVDGTGAAGRPGRRHRRSGVDRRHAESQQTGRGRGTSAHFSSRLVVNQAALKLKRERWRRFLDAFAGRREEGLTMVAIRRLNSTDAGFKAALDELLAFEGAQDGRSTRPLPPFLPT